jgi:hypothetical protein
LVACLYGADLINWWKLITSWGSNIENSSRRNRVVSHWIYSMAATHSPSCPEQGQRVDICDRVFWLCPMPLLFMLHWLDHRSKSHMGWD